MDNYYVNQKNTAKSKLKEDWYIKNAKYWVAYAINNKSQSDTAANINAANGIVDEATYKYVLAPLTADNDNIKLPATIRDVDFITPIREKNIGEYIQLSDTYSVKVDDPDITIKLREKIGQEVNLILQQMVINQMNQEMETGVDSKEMPNPESMIDDIKANVFDERAINASHMLKWLNDKNDLSNKKIEAFTDWWSCEEFYFRVFEQNNEMVYDRINPYNAFPIINDTQFVHTYDGFVIINDITIHKIKEFYDDKMSAKDKKYLDAQLNIVGDGKNSISSNVILDIYGKRIIDYNNTALSRDVSLSLPGSKMKEHIILFKTQVPVYIVYRINPLGELVAEIVNDTYELDETIGDMELKKEYIWEVWEQIVLGNLDSTGIYLKPTPISAQIYDEYGMVILPVFGKYGIASNIKINPIPKRIIPNLALYRIITLHAEREMAKYKGETELIPKSMLVGNNKELNPKDAMFYKKADGTIIWDDTVIDANIANAYRIVGGGNTGQYLRALEEIKQNLKAEAWDMANMNDGRYGNAAPSSTVTNNKDNIYRAKLGSVLMISMFNNALGKMFNSMLEMAKTIYPKGVSNSYFNEGRVIHFNMEGGELTDNKYGIFFTNSIKEDEKLQQYKDLGFAASQNGNFELAAKTIQADSTTEIGTYIKQFTDLDKKYQQQNAEANQKAMAEAADKLQKDELDKIQLKGDLDKEREIAVAEIRANDNSSKP